MNQQNSEDLLTNTLLKIKEAALLLGVHPMTLRRWEKAGRIKVRRHPINNYRLYKLQEIRGLSCKS